MPTSAAPQHTVLSLFWHYTYSKLTSHTYWASRTAHPTTSTGSSQQAVFASPSRWRDSLRSGAPPVGGPPHARSGTSKELHTRAQHGTPTSSTRMPTTAATQHTSLILFWHCTYSKLTCTYAENQELLNRALRLDLRCKVFSPLRRPGVSLCVAGAPCWRSAACEVWHT